MVTHNIECVSTRCNPNCMLGINLVSRCRSWWGSWGGRAPGSRGGVASKNLSGTAAASAAPPTLLFKLHLNPLDFLLGKINSHLPQTSMRLNWGELETWVPQLVEVSHWWPLRFEVSDFVSSRPHRLGKKTKLSSSQELRPGKKFWARRWRCNI